MLQHRLWLKALCVTLLPPGSVVVLRELTAQTAVFTGTLKSWCPSRPPTRVQKQELQLAGRRWRHDLIPNQFWLLYVRFRMPYRKVSIFH